MKKSNENAKNGQSLPEEKDLLKLILKILRNIFGDDELETLFFHLKIRKNLDRNEIIKKFDEFLAFLKEVFGELVNYIISSMLIEIEKNYGIKMESSEELLFFVKRITRS